MTRPDIKLGMPAGATGGRWEVIPDSPVVVNGVTSTVSAWGKIDAYGNLKGKTTDTAPSVVAPAFPASSGTWCTFRTYFTVPGGLTITGREIRIELKETSTGLMDIGALMSVGKATVVAPPPLPFTPVPATPLPVNNIPLPPQVALATARAKDVLLLWPAATSAVSYYVLRQLRTAGMWMMASGFLSAPAWTDQVLDDGVACNYKVMAIVGNATIQIGPILSVVQAVRGYDGPLHITQAGTYRGSWKSTDRTVSPVTVEKDIVGQVIIELFRAKGPGDLIRVGNNSDVIVRDGAGYSDHPGVAGVDAGKFVDAKMPKGISVTGCIFGGKAFGLYVDGQSTSTVQRIVFERNVSYNMNCLTSTATGWAQVKALEGHVFIANNCYNVANYSDRWNAHYQEYQVGLLNDAHNNYNSSGTASNPGKIQFNLVYGLWPMDGTADPHTALGASSGIAFISDGAPLADQSLCGRLIISDNWAIATSNGGVAVATGQNIELARNTVTISGYLPDGVTVNRATNVALYVSSQSGGTLANINAHDNKLMAWGRPGSLNNPPNTPNWYYNNPTFTPAMGSNGNVMANNLQIDSPGTIQKEFDDHLAFWTEMQRQGVSLGVQAI